MIKVIYIMGSGRSGSTVLDTVLGNHPEIESVGELTNLPVKGWINGEYCACGEQGNSCPFWKDVRHEWNRLTGADDVREYYMLQKHFERLRRLPLLLTETRWVSPDFRTYTGQTRALFEAIGIVSGKTTIVDSSKNPVRALALSMTDGIDLRLIHLVRDGRGVVWSLMKPYKKDKGKGIQRDFLPVPSWRTSLSWALVNYISEYVIRKARVKALRIRYEDFVEDPGTVLGHLGNTLGIQLDGIANKLETGREMTIGHMIAGNRVRMSGAIKLRRDYEWEKALPEKDRRIFRIIAGRLARKYGYT